MGVQFENAARVLDSFGRDIVIVVDVFDLNLSFGGNALERDFDRLRVFLFIRCDKESFCIS